METQVMQVNRVHQALKELKDFLVHQVTQDQEEILVKLVLLENLGLLAVELVNWVEPRGQILKLLEELRVNLEHQVREGPQEHLEGVAHLELVALVERLVYKESKDHLEAMVSQDLLEYLDKMVLMAYQESQD